METSKVTRLKEIITHSSSCHVIVFNNTTMCFSCRLSRSSDTNIQGILLCLCKKPVNQLLGVISSQRGLIPERKTSARDLFLLQYLSSHPNKHLVTATENECKLMNTQLFLNTYFSTGVSCVTFILLKRLKSDQF